MKFKLESVLKLRENTEKVKQKELGDLNLKIANIHNKIKELRETRREMAKAMNGEVINIQSRIQLNLYSDRVDKEIMGLEGEAERLARQAVIKKEELSEAVKQRKIIEKLKEKEIEKYINEENRKQNEIVDELISYKYSSIKVK